MLISYFRNVRNFKVLNIDILILAWSHSAVIIWHYLSSMKSAGDGLMVMDSPYIHTVDDLVQLHVNRQRSIPAFLAALTIELFSRQSMNTTSTFPSNLSVWIGNQNIIETHVYMKIAPPMLITLFSYHFFRFVIRAKTSRRLWTMRHLKINRIKKINDYIIYLLTDNSL